MRQTSQPSEIDLISPGRRDYWVTLEHGTMWGAYWIPLTVWVGPEAVPGKGVVAFGSTHGNEYEGPVALKNLLGEIATEDVRGRIIFIPVLNAEAFRSGTRDSVEADGVNLNRAFVEGAGRQPALAGITHRLAAFVRETIWPHVDVVLDLHAGGRQIRFCLCTSYHPIPDPVQGARIAELAGDFGTPAVITYQNETPGLLTSEAERLGKLTIGGEFGWGEAVHHQGVACARRGVLSVCIREGHLRGELPANNDVRPIRASIVDRVCYTSAPFPGHYEEIIPCGTRVRAGDLVGRLHDFARIDDPAWPVRAGVDGIVIAQAYAARVMQGQQILVVGTIDE